MIKKRWGKPFKDKRNWVDYTEELVVRGTFLLELDWVKNWKGELEKMNENKCGRPFLFPESLIKLQAVWSQWVDYRGIEGITRKLVEYANLPAFNDYTTINRRVNKLDLEFCLPKSGTVNVACDGTGIQMCDAGNYLEDKHGGRKRRKYIVVTISADPFTKKLFVCDVCVEGTGLSEAKTAEKHLKKLKKQGIKIEKFWGDGAYDVRALFNLLDEFEIKPAIKIRKTAVFDMKKGLLRAREVRASKLEGYKLWASKRNNGMRWIIEGVNSAVKRKFGEKTRAKRVENKVLEAKRKFWCYELMRLHGAAK